MKIITLALVIILLASCSLDVIPIHPSRVNSARNAERPLQRGPNAPGAFTKSWSFAKSTGYQFDPSKIEISDGLVRLKPLLQLKTGEGKFPTEKAILETSGGKPYNALDTFTETLGPNNRGEIRYQLSNDGSKWFYHDGSKWVPAAATRTQASRADAVNTHIGTFHSEVGNGILLFKAFLISPTGVEPVELKQIQITGVAPRSDGWD